MTVKSKVFVCSPFSLQAQLAHWLGAVGEINIQHIAQSHTDNDGSSIVVMTVFYTGGVDVPPEDPPAPYVGAWVA